MRTNKLSQYLHSYTAVAVALAFPPQLFVPKTVPLILAIIVSLLYGGLSAWLLALVLGVLGACYFLLSPLGSVKIASGHDVAELWFLILVSLLVALEYWRITANERGARPTRAE